MQKNKRRYHRIPASDAACTVIIDGVQLHGRMRDESISGAKISGLEVLMLPLNKKVKIECEGETLTAFARNAIRDEDGGFIIGFRRDETSEGKEDEDTAILVNCFITHHSSYAICVPIALESNNMVKVQLWNGKQFVVPYSSLQSMTRLERYENLKDGKHLSLIHI